MLNCRETTATATDNDGDEFDFDDDGGVERERVVIQEFVERSSGSIRYGFDRLFLVSPQPLTESCVVNHG